MPKPAGLPQSGQDRRHGIYSRDAAPLAFGDPHSHIPPMDEQRAAAKAQFLRMIAWIAGIGVLMAIAAIGFLAATGELHVHMVIATIGGVFFSILLGSGLFAASFFSDKSGHDQSVSDATRRKD
ncbi:MAG TPA: hypothetical protein VHN20_18415 [Beijerinckiaceae bacterium]|nr:hypothetical protein [Beijerinckiaceae bacterium]